MTESDADYEGANPQNCGTDRWECPSCGYEYDNQSGRIGADDAPRCIMCWEGHV